MTPALVRVSVTRLPVLYCVRILMHMSKLLASTLRRCNSSSNAVPPHAVRDLRGPKLASLGHQEQLGALVFECFVGGVGVDVSRRRQDDHGCSCRCHCHNRSARLKDRLHYVVRRLLGLYLDAKPADRAVHNPPSAVPSLECAAVLDREVRVLSPVLVRRARAGDHVEIHAARLA